MMSTTSKALTFSNSYPPLGRGKKLASPRQDAGKDNPIEIVDSFEKTPTKKPSVPPPKVVIREVPVTDKTSVVLATMGFIASLGAVFGVGLLYAKMNHANKGALHEVQTALAPLEKKLDRLEKQLKQKADGEDLESGLFEMRRLLLEAKSDLFFLYKQSSLQSHQINQLDEKVI